MATKINYTDKVNLKTSPVAAINKVKAEDMNEIKEVVNTNRDDFDAHVGDTNNPHEVTKSQVGLGNVDNTSDANKPISTATQTALNNKQDTLVSGTNIKTVKGVSLLGSGDVPIDENATHTGEVTGATALTVDKTAITNKTTVTAASADYVLISDTSDSGNLKKALVSDFGGSNIYNTNGTLTGTRVVALSSYSLSFINNLVSFRGAGSTNATTALYVENQSLATLLSIKDDGKTGLGTNSPARKLHIYCTNATEDNIRLTKSDVLQAQLGYYTPQGGYLELYNPAGSAKTCSINIGTHDYINTSLNFGIGTDTPTRKFHVNGSATEDGVRITKNSLSQVQLAYYTTGGYLELYNGAGNTKIISINIGTHDYINTSLNFGIGTDTPTAKFHVVGSTLLNGNLGVFGTTPIAQPTTGIASATFAANTSGIVNDTATFDGYTIGQVVKALRNLGILQ